MADRIRYFWHFMTNGLWFVPLLMCGGAILLAVILMGWGPLTFDSGSGHWLIYTGSPQNARELMGALLAGMITMTSLVISITMVVLTLAAGQIGPRLIRNFIQDRTTQTVLGLFLADILYLLVVFRTVEGGADGSVPHLAVSVGTFVTAVCLLVLLFFIHNLARSIIYDTVVRNVSAEVRAVIRRLLPDADGEPEQCPELPADHAWIDAGTDGYVQAVDYGQLIKAARKRDALLRLEFHPGKFVLERGGHVAVYPASARTEDLCSEVRSALVIGSERTPTQDVGYGIRQLVEIATRALSPGLNDVFTALAVLDNLAPVMADILSRNPEAVILKDEDGVVRVVRPSVSHADMIGTAFDQIRHSGGKMPAILLRLADTIGRLSAFVRTVEQQKALLEQLDMVQAAAEKQIDMTRDIGMILTQCGAARSRLWHALEAGDRRGAPS